MISNKAQREVASNSANTKEFSIQNSSKMFQMIISGLYSDKPQSVTREIWANAFDAHCMVGTPDKPFEITFPSSLTPTFTCRDFGPGIHHNDMEGFYTVLGHSTKENTNDAVGKWGVGRMSPMSYTDSFSVTSYHKGMVGYYSVQLGPDGAPQLHTMVPPSPTDQQDGLEVSFPVQRKDIGLFATAANRVSLGFDIKPVVRGQPNFVWPEVKKEFEGGGWFAFRNSYNSPLRGTYAKMGCVLYPIDLNTIRGSITNAQSNLTRHCTFIIDFDIGELEVTASREGLSYGRLDPTTDSVRKKLEYILGNIKDVVEEAIKKSPTYFDALIKKNQTNMFPSGTIGDVSWRGEVLSLSSVLTDDIKAYKGSYKSSYEVRRQRSKVGFTTSLTVSSSTHGIYISVVGGKEHDVRSGERIASHYHGSGSGKDTLWFKVESQTEATTLLGLLKARLGDTHTYTLVKDIPDTGPRVGTRTKTKLKSYEIGSRDTWEDYTMESEEFDKGGVYLPIVNNLHLDGQVFFGVVSKHLKQAKVITSDHLIVVPKTHWKKFEEATNWKPLWDVASGYMMKGLAKKKVFAISQLPRKERGCTAFAGLSEQNSLFKSLNSLVTRPEGRLIDGLTAGEMHHLLSILGVELPKSCPKTKELINTILDKYPLLESCLHKSFVPKPYVDYVAGIDLLSTKQTIAA